MTNVKNKATFGTNHIVSLKQIHASSSSSQEFSYKIISPDGFCNKDI
jgi:hypothetical protein